MTPTFIFASGQLVLNLHAGHNMTAGRLYRVHSSYHGYSGSGAQEWCRVADDSGHVTGYNPDRFIGAQCEHRTPNPYVVASALRSRKMLENLLREFAGESFSVIRTKLQGLFDDTTGVLLMTAEGPAQPQVTFFAAETYPRSDCTVNTMVCVDAQPVGWLRHYASKGAYSFEHLDQSFDLTAANYTEAKAAVLLHIKALVPERGDLGFWATTVAVDQTEDQRREFTAALG